MSNLATKIKPDSMTNTSGIWPTEFKVLVRVKDVETERTFKGPDGKDIVLAIMTPNQKGLEQEAEMEGEIVASSPLAFTYATWPSKNDIPKVGDRVVFARFAGANRQGRDGKTYRLINDKDVAAVLR